MPLQRNQPSPERQSVLSFVSPSVADLLFYETVDAKTVGAGGGKTVTSISSATQAVEVTAGGTYDGDYHESGFLVQVTSTAHGYVVGDVVTVINAPDGNNGLNANGTFEIRSKTDNNFVYFVRGSGSTSTWDAADVTAANTIVYKSHPQYGTAHPDTEKFPTHKLCYVKQADGEGLYFEYYYAAERLHQDDYNFEYSQADLGGNKYDTVVRTYVTLRSDFADADTEYPAGGAMPDPLNQFADTHILLTRQQKRIGDQELDGLFVVEQRVYFNRQDIVTQKLDSATDKVLETKIKLYYRGEAGADLTGSSAAIETAADDPTAWGLSATGVNKEVQQLSHDWWQVTVQDVIPQGLTDHLGGKVIRDYYTYQNFTWPAVLDGLVFTSVARKDGANNTAVTARMKEGKGGHSGPTKMRVRQVWKSTVFSEGTIPEPKVFKTTSGRYTGALYSVSVSNVLSGPITLTDFIGTEHPTFKMGDYAFPKPWLLASDPTDWPSSFVGSAAQKPFRGGYLLEIIDVYAP